MVLPAMPFFSFMSLMISLITGFSDSLPGNIFIAKGICSASKSRPMEMIGSFLLSLDGPFLLPPFSLSISK